MSLVYSNIRVNNLFQKYKLAQGLLIYLIKQVTIYTNENGWLKLNLALLSVTSPQCGKNVTCIELTLLSRNVTV